MVSMLSRNNHEYWVIIWVSEVVVIYLRKLALNVSTIKTKWSASEITWCLESEVQILPGFLPYGKLPGDFETSRGTISLDLSIIITLYYTYSLQIMSASNSLPQDAASSMLLTTWQCLVSSLTLLPISWTVLNKWLNISKGNFPDHKMNYKYSVL